MPKRLTNVRTNALSRELKRLEATAEYTKAKNAITSSTNHRTHKKNDQYLRKCHQCIASKWKEVNRPTKHTSSPQRFMGRLKADGLKIDNCISHCKGVGKTSTIKRQAKLEHFYPVRKTYNIRNLDKCKKNPSLSNSETYHSSTGRSSFRSDDNVIPKIALKNATVVLSDKQSAQSNGQESRKTSKCTRYLDQQVIIDSTHSKCTTSRLLRSNNATTGASQDKSAKQLDKHGKNTVHSLHKAENERSSQCQFLLPELDIGSSTDGNGGLDESEFQHILSLLPQQSEPISPTSSAAAQDIYSCAVCDTQVSGLDELRRHVTQRHGQRRRVLRGSVRGERRSGYCAECQVTFLTQDSFTHHLCVPPIVRYGIDLASVRQQAVTLLTNSGIH